MINKHKLVFFLIVLSLIFVSAPAYAASGVTVSVEVPSPASGTFNVNVNVDSVTDFDTAVFVVNFDSAYIELANAGAGELSPTASVVLNPDINKVLVNAPGFSGVSGSGSIAVLTFNTLQYGTSTISLSEVALGSNMGEDIPVAGAVSADVTTSEYVAPTVETNCADSLDDDNDGLVDCDDPDCSADASCVAAGPSVESVCDDGLDDDNDGLIDCDDPDCSADSACVAVEVCDDSLDNDNDGLIDCDDPDCSADSACVVVAVEVCDDSLDNDDDGLLDCDDPNCAADPACVVEETVLDISPGGEIEITLATDETASFGSGAGVLAGHSLALDAVSETSATITFSSTPQQFTLDVGAFEDLDADGDGTNDIRVTLQSTDTAAGNADFKIASLEAPAEEVLVSEPPDSGAAREPHPSVLPEGGVADAPGVGAAEPAEPPEQPARQQVPAKKPEKKITEQKPAGIIKKILTKKPAEEAAVAVGEEVTFFTVRNILLMVAGAIIITCSVLGVAVFHIQDKLFPGKFGTGKEPAGGKPKLAFLEKIKSLIPLGKKRPPEAAKPAVAPVAKPQVLPARPTVAPTKPAVAPVQPVPVAKPAPAVAPVQPPAVMPTPAAKPAVTPARPVPAEPALAVRPAVQPTPAVEPRPVVTPVQRPVVQPVPVAKPIPAVAPVQPPAPAVQVPSAVDNYIRTYLAQGYTKEQLRIGLMREGWNPAIVEAALKKYP